MDKIVLNVQDFIIRAENASDPRVKDWPLVQNVTSPLLAVFCYVLIVLIVPKIMKKRQPFELKVVMALYNIVAVALSAYMFIKIARVLWLHYMSKYFEMVDTVIFILRKKDNQVSFLHVYHHSSVTILWWIGTKWIPGGTSYVPAIVNSFVHVVMYTYYGFSMFPSLRKYLWWKRYLTQFQMIQFCLIFAHSLYVVTTDCSSIYPPWMAAVAITYMVTLLLLFGKFYLGAYMSPKTKNKTNGVENVGSYKLDDNKNKKLL